MTIKQKEKIDSSVQYLLDASLTGEVGLMKFYKKKEKFTFERMSMNDVFKNIVQKA